MARKKAKTKKNAVRRKKRPPIADDIAAHADYWKGELGATPDWPALLAQLKTGDVVGGKTIAARDLEIARSHAKGTSVTELAGTHGVSAQRVRQVVNQVRAAAATKEKWKTQPVFSAREAAEYLGISGRWVRTLCLQGRLGWKYGNRMYVITRDELEQFAAQPRPVGKPGQGLPEYYEEDKPLGTKDEVFTVEKAADYLGISARRVRGYCMRGRLGGMVGSTYIMSRDELDRFAARPRFTGNPGKGLFRRRHGDTEKEEEEEIIDLIDELEVGEVVNDIEVTERALAMAKQRVRGMNMREIGDRYGLSRERVRQITSRIEAVVQAKLGVRGRRRKHAKTKRR